MMRLFRKAPPAPAARTLETAVVSMPGTYAVNEDAAGEAAATGCALLAVADGLGGHERGEVASRLAVDRVTALFRRRPLLDPEALTELMQAAHRALRDADPGESGLRTTLTVLVVAGATARWAHVGDSRLYFFQGGTLRTRTRDHSVPEMLLRAGEIRDDEIRHHPDRSRLLQALGQDNDPRVAVSDAVTLTPGDAFLLCSDGWWENVTDREMESLLQGARRPVDWLTRMSEVIVAAAQAPQDNYSAIAAFVR
jgi:serine/threonine protein phosphatase PrpC